MVVSVMKRRLRGALSEPTIERVRRARRLARDARRVTAMLGATGLTSILPSSLDRPITAVIHAGYVRLRPGRIERYAGRVREVFDTADSPVGVDEARTIAIAYMRMRVEIRWLRARGAGGRPDRVPTAVEGFEHVEEALAQGRGVILWRMSTTSAAVLNAALAERGRPIVHLSAAEHMLARPPLLSRSWWGALNTRDEARWLAERVVIPADGSLGYLARLREALDRGGVVSIVGDLTTGRATVEHRIGTTTFALPTGAPSLSHVTGAALLPCAVLRTGPLSYTVTIRRDVADRDAVDRRAFRRAAVAQFGSWVEDVGRAHPDSWIFWGRAD